MTPEPPPRRTSRAGRRDLLEPALRVVRNRQLVLILLATLAGAAAACGAIVFRELVTLGQTVAFGASLETLSRLVDDLPAWQVVAAPTLGGLLIGLFVHHVMPERRTRGVADVMEAAARKSGVIGLREGLGAAAVSAASISVGASVGREGPVVHLGAALSSLLATRLRLSRSQTVTLLGCGVAAAIAASFNAPIAGVIFALEVVIGHYALNAFAPIVIAGVVGTVISRAYFGNFPAFIIPDHSIVSFWEFPAFALLGGACALAVIILLRSIAFSSAVAAKAPGPPWLRPMAGGLALGVVALAFPQVLGVGYEATDAALNGQYELALLIALVAAKTAATAICLGWGFGGGIFSPSLFIGAMVGGVFGIVATQVFPDLSSGHSAYTLVGLGAVSGAALGAPISTILIVFELTASYALTIAVMVAVVIASVIVRQAHGQSFFDWQLDRRGIDLAGGRERDVMASTRVADVMSKDCATVAPGVGIDGVRESLLAAPYGELFVVDEDGVLQGTIIVGDFAAGALDRAADGAVGAGDMARPHPPVLEAGDSLEQALKTMRETGEEHVAVVDDRESLRLVGFVHEVEVLLAYNRALVEARREERGEL